MSSFRYRPSKPAAVLSAVVGVGMLVFGISTFHDEGGSAVGFLVFWCAVVAGIVGLNLWSAFAKNGALGTYEEKPRT
ncbi:hypothetical protein [Motilibacter deserti]|uniref:Uncharacterized protein n=1 Tax=Motilibacter deserti TaxID=2714956 RepID=A0ABX0GZQ3_9ACTN|nr:hypothetical protein [Motilibacter deserti]NHC15032.1 hypothetical protein [Motilibacter deserti]